MEESAAKKKLIKKKWAEKKRRLKIFLETRKRGDVYQDSDHNDIDIKRVGVERVSREHVLAGERKAQHECEVDADRGKGDKRSSYWLPTLQAFQQVDKITLAKQESNSS